MSKIIETTIFLKTQTLYRGSLWPVIANNTMKPGCHFLINVAALQHKENGECRDNKNLFAQLDADALPRVVLNSPTAVRLDVPTS